MLRIYNEDLCLSFLRKKKKQPELKCQCFIWEVQSLDGKHKDKGSEVGKAGSKPRRYITVWTTAPRQAVKKVTAGCPAGEGRAQTGYAEKPCSASPSERGEKGNLSVYLPPVSISIVKVCSTGSYLSCTCVALSGPFNKCSGSQNWYDISWRREWRRQASSLWPQVWGP